MNKTLEGMADAAWSADDPSVVGKLRNLPATEALEARRMKAALLWLADNISDEMVFASIALPNDPRRDDLIAAFASPRHKDTIERTRACISRALRAAAGDGR